MPVRGQSTDTGRVPKMAGAEAVNGEATGYHWEMVSVTVSLMLSSLLNNGLTRRPRLFILFGRQPCAASASKRPGYRSASPRDAKRPPGVAGRPEETWRRDADWTYFAP